MGLATGDEDEIAGGHTERPSILEHDDGRTTAEIVEHRVREIRQRQTPGTAKLVVEQQGPTQANAVEHVSEDVHACRLLPRTVGYKLRTIPPYRPRSRHPSFWLRRQHR